MGQRFALVKGLEAKFSGNRARTLDIGLAEALGIQCASMHNMLRFYLMRARLFDLPPADALTSLADMEALVREEIRHSERLAVLCAATRVSGSTPKPSVTSISKPDSNGAPRCCGTCWRRMFTEYRAAFQAGRQVSRFAEGRARYACGSGWTACKSYRWRADRDGGDVVLKAEMMAPKTDGSFMIYLCDPFAAVHFWEIRASTSGTVSDSREIGLTAEPYCTPDGARGVALRLPCAALHLLDPSERAYAFNLFNAGTRSDNWPTGMDESDLGGYRLALGLFKPQKMGYLVLGTADDVF
jgi:hypothetical protein